MFPASQWASCWPRAYPAGLGDSLSALYLDELKRPVQGDLRVNLSPDPSISQRDLFANMSMGDCWSDADLVPVLRYLYFGKRTRTLNGRPSMAMSTPPHSAFLDEELFWWRG